MSYGFIQRAQNPYITIKFNGSSTISKEPYNLYLNSNSSNCCASLAGKYAVFAGGYSGSARLDNVNAFNPNGFGRINPTYLSVARDNMASATVGEYALFAGGTNSQNESVATVDAYDKNLVRTNPTNLYYPCQDLAGVSFNNCALFGGGYVSSTNSRSCEVNCYDSSLTRTMLPTMNYYPSSLSASSNANYAIFAGGYENTEQTQVSTANAYNTNFIRTTDISLSVPRERMATATAGNYAIFLCGKTANGYSNFIDAYDTSLNRHNLQAYGYYSDIASTTVGKYAVFAGGVRVEDSTNHCTKQVLIFKGNYAVLEYVTDLSNYKGEASATTVDNYVFIGGGKFGGAYYSDVEVYSIKDKVIVYPGTKYKLGSMANEVTADSMQTITVEPPIKGYIKIKSSNLP